MTEVEALSSILSLKPKNIKVVIDKETLSISEIQYLVSLYYQIQHYRITTNAQKQASIKEGASHTLIEFFNNEFKDIETQIKNTLNQYTDTDPVAWTLKQVVGIGPVIAAGLVANLDITRPDVKTAGSYWRYCGVDPSVNKAKKGEKRKYNADMKVLTAFKLGESFCKVQNKETAFYGKIFKEWKEEYVRRNEAGELACNAKRQLEEKNYSKTTDAYKAYIQGKLPPAHIHAMARRKPVMLLLSHMFDLQYMLHHHKKSPIPYIIAVGDHVHEIENPLIEIYESKYGKIKLLD